MNLSAAADNNRLALLIVGTIMFQFAVIVTGVLLKLSLPEGRVDLPQDSASLLAPQGDDSPADAASDITLPPGAADADSAAPAVKMPKIISYRLKAGDTLSKIWELNGASAAGAALAAQAFDQAHVPLKALRLGEEIELQISPSGDITALRKKLPDGKELLLDGDSVKGYKATITNPDLVQGEKVISGVISRSFSEAAQQASLPASVADELVDLFSARVEFSRELQPGDTFAVVYDEKRTADGQFIKAGPIKSASLEKGGRMLFALRYGDKSGKAAYYDQYGKPLGDSFLRYPLQFSRITSTFSYGRFHPILKKVLPHNGIDFAAPLGTPVRAVADGIVTFAGYSFGGGNMIKIKHGDRYATAYLHLSQIAKGLHEGSRLARGQVIGAVGSTGLSTGPHLHFSFYDRGRYVNPLQTELPSCSYDAAPLPPTILAAKVDQLIQSQQLVKLASARKANGES